MARLTKTAIDKLEARAARYEVSDDALSGFYIRVNVRGSKTAIVRYFMDGRLRSYTVGKLGEHFPLAEARAEARRLLGDVARGKDPAQDRKSRREACTFAELATRFMDDHVRAYRKATTWRGYESIVRVHLLPALGKMRVQEIERSDAERIHQRIGKHSHAQANRSIAVLSSMMTKAEAWGLRAPRSNPCYGVPKFKERSRERPLTGEERARLSEVLDAAEAECGVGSESVSRGAITAIRLLLLTGARRGEISGLQWSMVDLERSRLVLPDSKTGAKVIPLSPQTVTLLRSLEPFRVDGVQWVCPNNRGNQLDNLYRAWGSIRRRAGLDDVRPHDLRHSAATDMAAAGMSLPLIGAVLGHSSPQTTARYAHYMDTTKVEAARVMGVAIEQSTRDGAELLRQQRAVGDDSGRGLGGDDRAEGSPIGCTVIPFPGGRR